MPIIIGIAALYLFAWILGGLISCKGIIGTIANIILWVYRKAWLLFIAVTIFMIIKDVFID